MTEKEIIEIDKEVAFTQAWWRRCCADPAMMETWLKKLERTEISGFYDWRLYQTKFFMKDKQLQIAENIAQDEKKHSGYLIDLMDSRNIIPLTGNMHVSSYWDELNIQVKDLRTCAAVNYFGEALAAFRFEIIIDMTETPSDIFSVISKILPDEQFHRETLQRMAGENAIALVKPYHEAALLNLKKT